MSNALWTGILSAPSLHIPVRLFAGPREQHVEFRQIVDGAPLKRPTGVPASAIAKGYEFAKGRFLTVADAEVQMPPRSILPLTFVDPAAVSPLLLEAGYFVAPAVEPPDAETPYAALLIALREKNAAALTRIVLYHRERYLLIRPGSAGLVAHTLFYTNEQKSVSEFRTNLEAATPNSLVAARASVNVQPFSPTTLIDEQTAAIQTLLAAKTKEILDREESSKTPAPAKRKR